MSETVMVAIVAVVGTSLGATISPLIAVIREVHTERGGAKSDRLRTAAKVGECLVKFARTSPERFEKSQTRKAHTLAVEARFALAQHLPKGAGRVDRFVEFATSEIQRFSSEGPRVAAAEYASDRVLSWARGDVPPSKLRFFEVVRSADEWIIV